MCYDAVLPSFICKIGALSQLSGTLNGVHMWCTGKTRQPPLQRSGLISSLTAGIVGGFVLVAALVILVILHFNQDKQYLFVVKKTKKHYHYGKMYHQCII